MKKNTTPKVEADSVRVDRLDIFAAREKDDKGLLTVVCYITPEIAARWLRANTHNRRLREAAIVRLTGAIERGEYTLNGESIVFTYEGVLSDGAHRLTAIVRAGIGVWAVVVWGVSPDSQDSQDTGLTRTAADVFQFHHESNAHDLAAATSYLWYYRTHGWIGSGWTANSSPTRAQLLTVLEENPGLRDSLAWGWQTQTLMRGRSSGATLHYVFSRIDVDAADDFFMRFVSGEGLSAGHPILTLRDVLIRDGFNKPAMPLSRRTALIILAWNAYRKGRTLKRLQWTVTDAFPTAR